LGLALLLGLLSAWPVSPAALLAADAATGKTAEKPSPWGDFAEANFPFVSSVIDARNVGEISSQDNLTPRGLVLNLGSGIWAGFDTDLLRVAAIWDGGSVTAIAGAPRSYHSPFLGARPRGEFPTPDGTVWLANGIYPGWQLGDRFSSTDPREPQPSPEEVGRGSLTPDLGQFRGLKMTREGVRLDYTVGGTPVHEWMRASGTGPTRRVERRFRVSPSPQPLLLVVARITKATTQPGFVRILGEAEARSVQLRQEPEAWTVQVAPHTEPVEFVVALHPEEAGGQTKANDLLADYDAPASTRWPEEVVTQGVLANAAEAFVVDRVPLPLDNPWRRQVRLGDIQFFPNGRAAAVTVDGDVWLIDGLEGNLEKVRWRRFASGLHEPISLTIRDEEIFVFDRNGIWRLQDTNGDGEADVYHMFANFFTQTSDVSDLPNSIKLAPDGTFVISKGGQRRKTFSRDTGTVMRIATDGRSGKILGHGFRQPFVGVHPKTGMITASDQDGHNVPATPLYILTEVRDHGYPRRKTIPQILEKAHLPTEYSPLLEEPVVWMPRSTNSSGITQVWLTDAKMGPLNDALIHVGYNRPELLVVRLDQRTPRQQAAVMSFTRDLRFPPLSGSVNPRDGQLYIAGFNLNTTARISDGLARVRYTGKPYLMPQEVVAMDQGLLLRFDVPLDPKQAVDPDNYTVARWNYKRTPNYASPPYRPDGSMGRDAMIPSSAYLSADGKSVFIGLPNMQPGMMQLHVEWKIATREGASAKGEAVTSPFELARFIPQHEGFGDFAVDLTPSTKVRPAIEEPISPTAGARLARSIGCYACHSTDGTKGLGPTWKGLAGSLRTLKTGEELLADEEYLRESILHPAAKVVEGYEEGMPGFAGIMGEAQIKSLVLYIQSLQFK